MGFELGSFFLPEMALALFDIPQELYPSVDVSMQVA